MDHWLSTVLKFLKMSDFKIPKVALGVVCWGKGDCDNYTHPLGSAEEINFGRLNGHVFLTASSREHLAWFRMDLECSWKYTHRTLVEAAVQMLNSPGEEWGGGEALKSTVALIQVILFLSVFRYQNHFMAPSPTPWKEATCWSLCFRLSEDTSRTGSKESSLLVPSAAACSSWSFTTFLWHILNPSIDLDKFSLLRTVHK